MISHDKSKSSAISPQSGPASMTVMPETSGTLEGLFLTIFQGSSRNPGKQSENDLPALLLGPSEIVQNQSFHNFRPFAGISQLPGLSQYKASQPEISEGPQSRSLPAPALWDGSVSANQMQEFELLMLRISPHVVIRCLEWKSVRSNLKIESPDARACQSN